MTDTKDEGETSGARTLVDRLRSDILVGTYRPGEWLRQVDLQETYEVTRFQVRRALDDLLLMGLVDYAPNRGYRLVSPSDETRSELTEVRVILEREAARKLVHCATDVDIGAMAAAAATFEKAAETGSYTELRELNHNFHRALLAPLRNATMVNLINDLRERDLPGNWNGWNSASGIRSSAQDHHEMVEALRARDATRFVAVVERHLTRWKESAGTKV